MKALIISNLQVSTGKKLILRGISLTIKPGELHVLMGPNGSGKTTLAYVLAGHPDYRIKKSKQIAVSLDGGDLLSLAPDERAQKGLFLAFQYPVAVPGVKVLNFLWTAYKNQLKQNSKKSQFINIVDFRDYLLKLTAKLEVKPELIMRSLNEDFSGGERKKLELLQMTVLKPKYAIFDETDSGLDIDAIKVVARGIEHLRQKSKTGILVITHYQRILKYLSPHYVHVMVDGLIVKTGDVSLIDQIEKDGYQQLTVAS